MSVRAHSITWIKLCKKQQQHHHTAALRTFSNRKINKKGYIVGLACVRSYVCGVRVQRSSVFCRINEYFPLKPRKWKKNEKEKKKRYMQSHHGSNCSRSIRPILETSSWNISVFLLFFNSLCRDIYSWSHLEEITILLAMQHIVTMNENTKHTM